MVAAKDSQNQLLRKWELDCTEKKHDAAQASSQTDTDASTAVLELVGRDKNGEIELPVMWENKKRMYNNGVVLYLLALTIIVFYWFSTPFFLV
jgi:hypothetical protein